MPALTDDVVITPVAAEKKQEDGSAPEIDEDSKLLIIKPTLAHEERIFKKMKTEYTSQEQVD
jgi:hypothetical protein